jgi:hypothetical protein
VTTAFYLLSIAGTFGAFDVLFYHIYTCRLYSRRQSLSENVTHFLRALLFSCFFLVIMGVQAKGAWWWIYPGLCTVEMINSMLDTHFERDSRKDQGGLPHGEYCLHVFLSVLMGGIMIAMLDASWAFRTEATELTWQPIDIPPFLMIAGFFAAGMGFLFFIFESSGVLRMLMRDGERADKPAVSPAR